MCDKVQCRTITACRNAKQAYEVLDPLDWALMYTVRLKSQWCSDRQRIRSIEERGGKVPRLGLEREPS